MRILASNPDSIGDFVLRQPIYAALSAAGHELLLVVRSFVAPLLAPVAPKASGVELESNPYGPAFSADAPDVRRILAAARDFAPDVFCIAPYQRTVFDEFLARSLEGCLTVGMAGNLYRGDINAGLDCESNVRLDRQVTVPAEAHELQKNERLCGALLGRTVKLPDPAIQPETHQIDVAEARLTRLGLRPGQYWIGCVGHSPYTRVRNWSAGKWAQVLSYAAGRYGRRFLLIGTPDENGATEEVLGLMGSAAESAENLCGAPEALDTILGLIHLSAGYIGRDTGPMHLAAAMDKPVLAVFGGGTWPRFIPAAKTGAVLTLSLPCAGCDWTCHVQDSYCVKRVSVPAVIEAMDAIESGEGNCLRVQAFPPDEAMLATVIREGGGNFRELWRRLGAVHQHLRAACDDADAGSAGLPIEASRAQEAGLRAEKLAGQLARRHVEQRQSLATLRRDAETLHARLREAAEALDLEVAETRQAVDLANDLAQEIESFTAVEASLRRQLAESEADRAALQRAERELRQVEAQVAAQRAQLAALQQAADLANGLRQQLAESEADRAARIQALQHTEEQLREAEAQAAARQVQLAALQEAADLADDLAQEIESLTAEQAELRRRLADSEADRAASIEASQRAERQLREAEAQAAAQQQRLQAMEQIVGLGAFRTAIARIAGARGKRISETRHLLAVAWHTLRSRRAHGG